VRRLRVVVHIVHLTLLRVGHLPPGGEHWLLAGEVSSLHCLRRIYST
jgi:hypothetical protein